MLEMFGCAVTVKGAPLLARPPTVTTTFPVVAPLGTVTPMKAAFQNEAAPALIPLNVTVLPPPALERPRHLRQHPRRLAHVLQRHHAGGRLEAARREGKSGQIRHGIQAPVIPRRVPDAQIHSAVTLPREAPGIPPSPAPASSTRAPASSDPANSFTASSIRASK
jgi:hypothetical protein